METDDACMERFGVGGHFGIIEIFVTIGIARMEEWGIVACVKTGASESLGGASGNGGVFEKEWKC